ncbi:MAG: hypothetical protein HY455_00725 [Parcubacteria group bacterium]|nr:hypothetical protein [Parcubacteria group bacterium]
MFFTEVLGALQIIVLLFSLIAACILLMFVAALIRRYHHIREQVQLSGMTDELWDYLINGPIKYDEAGIVRDGSPVFSITIERLVAVAPVFALLIWWMAREYGHTLIAN